MFAALLFVGAGCATYHPESISPEQSAAQLEGRRLDDPGLKQFLEQNLGHSLTNWPKTNWDLPELTLVAFYFHPSVEVARAEWLVANAGIKTAGARPNPSVNVAPAYDTQIPGNYSPWLARAIARPYFIQMKGIARLTGRIGGRVVTGEGTGFFETYR